MLNYSLFYFDPQEPETGYVKVGDFESLAACEEAATLLNFYRIEMDLGYGSQIHFEST